MENVFQLNHLHKFIIPNRLDCVSSFLKTSRNNNLRVLYFFEYVFFFSTIRLRHDESSLNRITKIDEIWYKIYKPCWCARNWNTFSYILFWNGYIQGPKLPRLPEYIINFNDICLLLLKLSPSIVFHQRHTKIINSGIVLATSFLKWDEIRTSNTYTQEKKSCFGQFSFLKSYYVVARSRLDRFFVVVDLIQIQIVITCLPVWRFHNDINRKSAEKKNFTLRCYLRKRSTGNDCFRRLGLLYFCCEVRFKN